LYVMFMRDGFTNQLKYAGVLILVGLIIYLVRSYRRGEYPFAGGATESAST